LKNIYLKFGKNKYLQDLRKGTIRFTCPITYNDIIRFSNDAILDQNEGCGSIDTAECDLIDVFGSNNVIINISNTNTQTKLNPSEKVVRTERRYYKNAHKDRVFCTYRLDVDTDNNIIKPIDDRNINFNYDSFIIINDIQKLTNQIKRRYQDYFIDIGDVSYEDKNSGRNAFTKPKSFCYQNETRILITDNSIPDYNDGKYCYYDLKLSDISCLISEIYDFRSLFSAKKVDDFVIRN